MQWGFLSALSCQDRVGPAADEEGGRKRVASQDGQMEKGVTLQVLYVQVTLVADEGVGDALVAAEQSQIEGDATLRVTLVELVGELGTEGGE